MNMLCSKHNFQDTTMVNFCLILEDVITKRFTEYENAFHKDTPNIENMAKNLTEVAKCFYKHTLWEKRSRES